MPLFVVHWSIWIIDPVLGRLEVVGSSVSLAHNRGDLWRRWIQEDSLCGLYSIPAEKIRSSEEKYKEEEKGPVRPSLEHGGQAMREEMGM